MFRAGGVPVFEGVEVDVWYRPKELTRLDEKAEEAAIEGVGKLDAL